MQQAVLRHNQQREERHRPQVRIGLHVGETIRDEDDYFGTPVVVAKRLCDCAKGGQIVASDLVRRLVGSRGRYTFRDYEVTWREEGYGPGQERSCQEDAVATFDSDGVTIHYEVFGGGSPIMLVHGLPAAFGTTGY